jgi:hypothetical protein
MDRRAFLAAMAAGAIVTAEGLWIPGKKLISIPNPLDRIFKFRIKYGDDVVDELSQSLKRTWAKVGNRYIYGSYQDFAKTYESMMDFDSISIITPKNLPGGVRPGEELTIYNPVKTMGVDNGTLTIQCPHDGAFRIQYPVEKHLP